MSAGLVLVSTAGAFSSAGRASQSKSILYLVLLYSSSSLSILIGAYVFKNHDDFPYYHFPYTHLLTEYSGVIGLGNFTHGFKTPSSVFYFSSLLHLPFVEYYLFHLIFYFQ